MARPSNDDFITWTGNDGSVSQLRNALQVYPYLVKVKDAVRFTRY